MATDVTPTTISRAEEVARLRDVAFGPSIFPAASRYEEVALRREYSEALDRAEVVESDEEATRLMRRSCEVGDTLLARALARVSFDRGYSEALREYAGAFPDLEDTIAALRAAA